MARDGGRGNGWIDGAASDGMEWREVKKLALVMADSERHANWMVNPERATNWMVYSEISLV